MLTFIYEPDALQHFLSTSISKLFVCFTVEGCVSLKFLLNILPFSNTWHTFISFEVLVRVKSFVHDIENCYFFVQSPTESELEHHLVAIHKPVVELNLFQIGNPFFHTIFQRAVYGSDNQVRKSLFERGLQRIFISN